MIFRRRKFFNFNQCCDRAEEFCEAPCAGQSCSAGCRVKCGFFSSLCPAVSCGVANPAQCTGGSGGGSTSSCDSGYTLAGSRCYKLVTSSSNYLQVWILTWIVVIILMVDCVRLCWGVRGWEPVWPQSTVRWSRTRCSVWLDHQEHGLVSQTSWTRESSPGWTRLWWASLTLDQPSLTMATTTSTVSGSELMDPGTMSSVNKLNPMSVTRMQHHKHSIWLLFKFIQVQILSLIKFFIQIFCRKFTVSTDIKLGQISLWILNIFRCMSTKSWFLLLNSTNGFFWRLESTPHKWPHPHDCLSWG